MNTEVRPWAEALYVCQPSEAEDEAAEVKPAEEPRTPLRPKIYFVSSLRFYWVRCYAKERSLSLVGDGDQRCRVRHTHVHKTAAATTTSCVQIAKVAREDTHAVQMQKQLKLLYNKFLQTLSKKTG